ncbi:hypothetical protein DL93DRAFT_1087213 [Clavulina sp. PMI_390]|nr:hypothetical protein DL93DRAFT_1087213 [Clavulina sp. PMI_390]
MQTIKCVAVGDSGVGKTCLLLSHRTHEFPTTLVPTVSNTYAVTAMCGNDPYTLSVFDTAADPKFHRLRALSYPVTDVFLLCFSIESRQSFQSIMEKWFPEVHHHCPGTACLLVGMKSDLRNDPDTVAKLARQNQTPVTRADGERLATNLRRMPIVRADGGRAATTLGGCKYFEVSALTHDGVAELFEQVIITAITPLPKSEGRGGHCVVV